MKRPNRMVYDNKRGIRYTLIDGDMVTRIRYRHLVYNYNYENALYSLYADLDER